MLLLVTEWLWQDKYWFPPGFTWEDMKETEVIRYPQPRHLLLGIPFALLLLGIRFFFERLVAVPLSRKMGLQEKVRRKAAPNPILEAFYIAHSSSPKEDELDGLAKQCDLQPRQVEWWFRCRRNQDRPSLTKKFCEASWYFTFHLISFCTGLAILLDPLLPSIFVYYMLQLAFYCSLVMMLPFDIKRKDFLQKIVHHVSTIFLISFSYCANYLRISTLVMIILGTPDFIMEPAKIFNYLKWHRICNTLFIIFSAVFLSTRLVVFPYKVLYNTYYYSMELCQPFFGYYFMNTLLMVLQVLNIFWSCLIIHMVYKLVVWGTQEKDARSDTDESEREEELTEQEKEKAAKEKGVLHPSNGRCLVKEIPLQLNGRSHPVNGYPKSR